jgi:hypothetical protein
MSSVTFAFISIMHTATCQNTGNFGTPARG